MKSFPIKTLSITGAAATFLLVTVLASAGHAIVFSANDPIFGPGALTRDTHQMLDFLDLTESTNMTYNEVSGEFGGTGVFAGFRHATELEVLGLINNFGFSPGAQVDLSIRGDTGGDQLSELVFLLGNPWTSSDFDLRLASGITSNLIFPGTLKQPPTHRRITLVDVVDISANDGVIGTNQQFDTVRFDSVGHFLVRTSQASPIPEPTTIFLFGSGLAGMAGYRWYQRRREGTQVG